MTTWEQRSVNQAGAALPQQAPPPREQRARRFRPDCLWTDQAQAVIAHDLRSPLGVIQTALHVLRKTDSAGPSAERVFATIERQIGYMSRLVEDLLDLALMKTGKLELRPEWHELTAVVNSSVEACRPLLEENRHRLTISLPPGTILVHADPLRVQQVLVNLLSNACKYTDPGGHIRLTAEAVGGTLVVRVGDDGMGIALDLLPHVFDLFEQGPELGIRCRGGLGIGLALVKWLVELHGGSITAHSDGPGTGSEFVVHLPIIRAREARQVPLALAPPHSED